MLDGVRATALEHHSLIKYRAIGLTPFIYILTTTGTPWQRTRLMQNRMPAGENVDPSTYSDLGSDWARRGSKHRLIAQYFEVETLSALMHNRAAFTSPVGEVVARGEDSWPLGGGCGRPPPAYFFEPRLFLIILTRPLSTGARMRAQPTLVGFHTLFITWKACLPWGPGVLCAR